MLYIGLFSSLTASFAATLTSSSLLSSNVYKGRSASLLPIRFNSCMAQRRVVISLWRFCSICLSVDWGL